jgi:hypothetical protein
MLSAPLNTKICFWNVCLHIYIYACMCMCLGSIQMVLTASVHIWCPVNMNILDPSDGLQETKL